MFLIGLASWTLCYSHKIYFNTFWLNLDKFLQKVMGYDLFVEERYNISRINDTYKKYFTCIFLKHRHISHINNLLLIQDLCYLWWRVYAVIIEGRGGGEGGGGERGGGRAKSPPSSMCLKLKKDRVRRLTVIIVISLILTHNIVKLWQTLHTESWNLNLWLKNQ